MPTVIIPVSELFNAHMAKAREESEAILRLADLKQKPLAPGETADTRRHLIAKHAKVLAETYLSLDDLVRAVAQAREEANDVTAGPVATPTTDNPDAN